MKSLLAVAVLLITVSTAAYAVDTPVAMTPEGLGKFWAHAIEHNSVDELKPLLHPDCAKGTTSPAILSRMVSGGLAPNYTFTAEDMNAPAEQLDKIFLVRPEKTLIIRYNTSNDDDKHRYGIGKAFPIARKDGHWYFDVCKK